MTRGMSQRECSFPMVLDPCWMLSVRSTRSLHFAWVLDHEKCIVVTRVCVSVCPSVRGRMPTLLHGPGCNLREWWGWLLVVHYRADLQSVHGLRCYGNTMEMRGRAPAVIRQAHRTQCHVLRMPAKTPLAGDKIDAPAACAVPFRPYCGGVVTRTRNVSEYMLVLGLCLVDLQLIHWSVAFCAWAMSNTARLKKWHAAVFCWVSLRLDDKRLHRQTNTDELLPSFLYRWKFSGARDSGWLLKLARCRRIIQDEAGYDLLLVGRRWAPAITA